MALGLFWKPKGIGSQEFLGQLKRELSLSGKPRENIGHCGTLDPFAQGLLLVGFFEGTKILAPLTGLDKTYIASFVWAGESDTLDSESEIRWHSSCPTHDEMSHIDWQGFLDSQLGSQMQVPPQYSAKHIDGKRAYEWARMGESKTLKAQKVELKNLKFKGLRQTSYGEKRLSIVDIECRVSSGTYIRSLARDFGIKLFGRPGFLLDLVRIGVGPWQVESALEVPQWLKESHLSEVFMIKQLNENEALALKNKGQLIGPDRFKGLDRPTLLVNSSGRAVAWLPRHFDKSLGRVFQKEAFSLEVDRAL